MTGPAPYITAAEILEDPALERINRMPSGTISGYIAEFEETAEAYLDIAYRPRTATWETALRRRTSELAVPHARVHAEPVVKVNGDTLPDRLVRVDGPSGRVRFRHGYSVGIDDQVVVEYTHGLEAPPARLVRACKRYVVNEASSDVSGTSRNIIGQSVDGSYIRYSTPDWSAGRPTGWLDVDNILNGMRGDRPVLVA